jgi:hypothetical protein
MKDNLFQAVYNSFVVAMTASGEQQGVEHGMASWCNVVTYVVSRPLHGVNHTIRCFQTFSTGKWWRLHTVCISVDEEMSEHFKDCFCLPMSNNPLHRKAFETLTMSRDIAWSCWNLEEKRFKKIEHFDECVLCYKTIWETSLVQH